MTSRRVTRARHYYAAVRLLDSLREGLAECIAGLVAVYAALPYDPGVAAPCITVAHTVYSLGYGRAALAVSDPNAARFQRFNSRSRRLLDALSEFKLGAPIPSVSVERFFGEIAELHRDARAIIQHEAAHLSLR